jgi:hypothetical protein
LLTYQRKFIQQIQNKLGLKTFGTFLLNGVDNGAVYSLFSKRDQDPAPGHNPLIHSFRYLIGIEPLNGQW